MNTRQQLRSIRLKGGLLVSLALLAGGQLRSQTVTAGVNPPADVTSTGKVEKAVANPVSTKDRTRDDQYVIGAGDVLAVNVWKEPDISKSLPVRSDGMISLPLAGEVEASGKTPKTLERDITLKLQSYISDPEVTVIVEEIKSQRFNILGQVTKPGTYLLTDSTTVLDAIAMAGGFRDFAKRKGIYVLRTNADGSKQRLPFDYKKVIKGAKQDENVVLEPHDTVVVP
jgi:polysaccharide export outer membrane protein